MKKQGYRAPNGSISGILTKLHVGGSKIVPYIKLASLKAVAHHRGVKLKVRRISETEALIVRVA